MTDNGRPHIRNNCYTGGIDAHQAKDWVIRDNVIEGFWCDSGLSEHGIHLWRGSRGTLIERNLLNNNARGIGFGLATSGNARTYPDAPCPEAAGGYVDHYDGIVRNNFVFANEAPLFASNYGFDCGICLWQACGAKVLNNTVVSTSAPFSSIEWRFDNTSVDIRNNIASHNLRGRGGSANLENNIDQASLAMFVDGSGGDLHLLSSATSAIDQASLLMEVTDDIDGELRPVGAAPDIGADEFSPVDCSGDVVVVSNRTFAFGATTTCIGQTSIAIGPNVVVKSDDKLQLFSPMSLFKIGVRIEQGAILAVNPLP